MLNSQEDSRAFAEKAAKEVSTVLGTDSVHPLAPQKKHGVMWLKTTVKAYLDVSVLKMTRARDEVVAVGVA